MRDARIEKLFLRYRERGDAAALGKVFDGTADELYQVALNLVSEPADADDIVQETYITVLERAKVWEPSRRLVPWMIGILVNHAHNARRRDRRRIEPAMLEEREVEAPEQELMRVELSEKLLAALRRLQGPSREVLECFFREGLKSVEIATRLNRAPGTVRMQMHRGLEQLRQFLPAGAALSALVLTAGIGKAGVREIVLRRGAELSAGKGLATGASSAGFLSKLGLVILPLAALTWVMAGGAGISDGQEEHARAIIGAELAGSDTARDEGRSLALREAEDGRAGVAPWLSAPANPAAVPVHARIVDPAGRALASCAFEAFDFSPEGAAAREVTRGRTLADGTLQLALDPRGTWAISLETQPAVTLLLPQDWATRVDLGLLVLPEGSALRIRLQDAEGEGSADARLRGWARMGEDETDALVLAGLGNPLLLLVDGQLLVADASPELTRITQFMPLAETHSDPRGWLTLASSQDSPARLLVETPDGGQVLLRAADDSFPKDLILPARRHLRGTLVKEGGAPAAGWEVRACSSEDLPTEEALVPLLAASRCDQTGAFELPGLPAECRAIVLASRAGPLQPWSVQEVPCVDGVQVVLAPDCGLSVRVIDGVSGQSLPAEVSFALVQAAPGSRFRSALLRSEPLEGTSTLAGSLPITRALRPGRYAVSARCAGYAGAAEVIDVDARDQALTLRLLRELPRSLRLVRDGKPLAGATVRIFHRAGLPLLACEARADEHGQLTLGGLAQDLPQESVAEVVLAHGRLWSGPAHTLLRGREPELDLTGASLWVSCLDRNKAPLVPLQLVLTRQDPDRASELLDCAFAWTDDTGRACFNGLLPGKWMALATGQGPFARPASLLALLGVPIYAPPSIPRSLDPLEEAEVQVDLQRFDLGIAPPRGACTLLVRTSLGGAPAQQAQLRLQYLERSGHSPLLVASNARGEARFDTLASGAWQVRLVPDPRQPQAIVLQDLFLEEGKSCELFLNLMAEPLELRVLQPSGRPAVSGRLQIADEQGLVRTLVLDGEGSALFYPPLGEATAFIDHSAGSARVVLGKEPAEVVRLSPGMEVSGSLILNYALLPERLQGYSQIPGLTFFAVVASKQGAPEQRIEAGVLLTKDAPGGAFSWHGMEPGIWEVQVYPGGEPHLARSFVPIMVEIGADTTSVGDLRVQLR